MTAPNRKTGAALAGLIAVVVAGTTAVLTKPNEGMMRKPYRDPVGIKTVCYGETVNVQDRIYGSDECATMLRTRMARDYAAPLVACVPSLADPANVRPFGALADFAYNAGTAAACRSPMAKAFRAGKWADGCRAFVGYYTTAAGKRLPGLVRRRKEEAAYCMGAA